MEEENNTIHYSFTKNIIIIIIIPICNILNSIIC